MKLEETLTALERHGVPEQYYTVGGISGGEFGGGIENIDGTWVTYQTERGKKVARQSWYSEEEACAVFFANVLRAADWSGFWGNPPDKLDDV